ncbi:unnamed protein product [Brachionus calyciflorus]|uniref:N-acetylgalactosaminide beta-1,3-galactosyltransferase n=1 Tax=Brachionus calyciflorus TaxID=104777 RepID=A0A814CBY4_9BILA|nr:unnamed protein product [Brachionus calyciflorus]
MVHDTWARRCTNYKFILKIPPNLVVKNNQVYYNDIDVGIQSENILDPGIFNDTYRKLTDKVYKTLVYLVEKDNNYDWYLKADDDTYIFVDNLRKFLNDKNSSEPVTYGFDLNRIVEKGYHSGGAGYIMSKEALTRIGTRLSKNYKSCPNRGFEDVDVAACFRLVKVYPQSSRDYLGKERFHPLPIRNHYYGWFPKWFIKFSAQAPAKGLKCCSDESISFHYMKPSDLYRLDALVERYEKIKSKCNQELRFIDIAHELLG